MNVFVKCLVLLLVGISAAAHAQTGNVGIGTTTPNAKLHVDGDLLVDDLPSVTNATQSVVLDPNTGKFAVASYSSTTATVGDAKQGFQSGDHAGWVLLNGRNVNTLTSNQQTAATSLGFGSSLPNASNAYLVQNGAALGSVSGSSTKTIARNQLPNVILSGTTSTNGNHNHTSYYKDPARSGGTDNGVGGGNGWFGFSSRTTSSNGNHNHTFTTSSINGGVTQQSFDITPRSMSVNTFVYLGN